MNIIQEVLKYGLDKYIRRASRQTRKATSGPVVLPGLQNSAEVLIDKWGVPHVYARKIEDIAYVQGFLHARDRLFQMDISRRVATGRLSEWFGNVSLDTDRLVRTAGLHLLAKNDLPDLSAKELEILEVYAAGVNAAIYAMREKLPPEYKLLKVTAAPWTPLDTCAIARLMAWQMSRGWYHELVSLWIEERAGSQIRKELGIRYPSENPIKLPKGVEFNSLADNGMLNAATGPFLGQVGGSNAWAVSASRSETGSAVLCNDPHLPMGLPSIWYENHLSCEELEVTGVSVPGAPFVVIGHNRNISWGVTLSYIDAEDLVLEEFTDQDSYRTSDGIRKAEIRTELIEVKGQEQHKERVVSTRNGPLIGSFTGDSKGRKFAIRSKALQPGLNITSFMHLNKAEGWNDFVGAVKSVYAPQLNIAYADQRGNIGFWVSGEIPIRAHPAQTKPESGVHHRREWTGSIPFEEMPHALNPERGYLISCNNKIVPDDYPYDLGSIWMNGYRAKRLENWFEKKSKISLEDCKVMQSDTTSVAAVKFQDLYQNYHPTDSLTKKALELFLDWDCNLKAKSPAAAIYSLLRKELAEVLLDGVLEPGLAQKAIGDGFHPIIVSFSEFYGSETEFLPRILNDVDSVLCWQAGGKEKVLTTAFEQVVEELKLTLGNDAERWEYGNFHQLSFRHLLSARPPLDRIFDIGPFPLGGDSDTPAQAGSPTEFDRELVCASWRQIIDTGNWDNCFSVLPPGNSGLLGDPHYSDQLKNWLEGEYKPMLWSRKQVELHAEQKIYITAN